ncbi:hypothetical protein [Teredinibacter purpureus]|uniref:hypothetical protein n=1 Tax=Teredinibacter purpureus TaxID=2731756 RepID=UPI0013C51213|nr:hypothetical protein [Teredinibacter purpureus]
MEEIIDVGEHAFSLREISQIANDENILARYEKNYPNELYSMIMMSLTQKKIRRMSPGNCGLVSSSTGNV